MRRPTRLLLAAFASLLLLASPAYAGTLKVTIDPLPSGAKELVITGTNGADAVTVSGYAAVTGWDGENTLYLSAENLDISALPLWECSRFAYLGSSIVECRASEGFGQVTISTQNGDDHISTTMLRVPVRADAGAGDDTVEFAGSDHVNDTLVGGDGDDTLTANGGDDTLDGGDGDDRLGDFRDAGASGNDTFNGGDGDDTITARDGTDTLNGEDGNDTLRGGSGSDRLDGGNGTDTLNGRDGTDTLNGADGNDTLHGGDGPDQLDGGTGRDTLDGGAAADTLSGGAGSDTADYSTRVAPVRVTLDAIDDDGELNEHDTISSDVENVTGGGGDDTLTGNSAANQLNGGDGDDTLDGGTGSDTLSGGSGRDTLTYATRTNPVEAGPLQLANAGEAGENDHLTADFETLIGGSGDDKLGALSDADATIIGNAGHNRLAGAGGDDTLIGGDDTNDLSGMAGDDMLIGGAGVDAMMGNTGNDTLRSGPGTDLLLGGEGNDTADYSERTAPVTVDLDPGCESFKCTRDGEAGEGDYILTDVENILGGSGDDTLTGSDGNDPMTHGDGANRIDGGAGKDTIDGLGGDDTLTGGDGDDVITGGAGADLLRGEAGNDTLHADDHAADRLLDCGGDVDDASHADAQDPAQHCEETFATAGAPTVTLTATPKPLSARRSAQVSFSVSEPASVRCRLDGGAWTACSDVFTSAVSADGEHSVQVQATDLIGNVGAPVTTAWTVDTTAPALRFTHRPRNGSLDRNPTFAFAAEPGAIVQCQLNHHAWKGCSSPRRLTRLSARTHTLRVRATDRAGNAATIAVERRVSKRTRTITRTVHFGTYGPRLGRKDAATVTGLRRYAGAAMLVSIAGHASSPADPLANERDARSLARHVRSRLLHGLRKRPQRVIVRGYGNARQTRSRRVEIRIRYRAPAVRYVTRTS